MADAASSSTIDFDLDPHPRNPSSHEWEPLLEPFHIGASLDLESVKEGSDALSTKLPLGRIFLVVFCTSAVMMMTECCKTQLWFLRGLSASEVGLKIPGSHNKHLDRTGTTRPDLP